MKKIIILLAVMAVATIAVAKGKEPFKGWNKLDMGAKDSWTEWKKAQEAVAEVMVRTTVPVKKEEKKILSIVGFKYRSVIPYKGTGAILTGSIPMEHLDELTAVEFVDYIEGAMKLSPKGGGKKGPGVYK